MSLFPERIEKMDSTKTCIFIFGRHPELSLVELFHVLRAEDIPFIIRATSKECALIDMPIEHAPLLQSRLGGMVKIGVVAHTLWGDSELKTTDLLEPLRGAFPDHEKRFTFGISAYTLTRGTKKRNLTPRMLQSLGLDLKKELKAAGSIRFVAPKGRSLSSVQVTKNNLADANGCELLLVEDEAATHIGITLSVQDFEEFSFRDWERPHRSMETGLLPPKLARIMLNATGLSPRTPVRILDPFCGLGTVLQEGLLMGFSSLCGSDIEKKNISAAGENLAWLATQKNISFDASSLRLCDARRVSHFYPYASLDAIVTEPYLGPIFSKPPRDLKKISAELSDLYVRFYTEAYSILKPSGSIVAVWPVWRTHRGATSLPILEQILSLGYRNTTIPRELTAHISEKTSRDTLLYARPEQIIARELIILRKD